MSMVNRHLRNLQKNFLVGLEKIYVAITAKVQNIFLFSDGVILVHHNHSGSPICIHMQAGC